MVDPSSGSTGSQPGYALYNKLELVDSGKIPIGTGKDIAKKLRELCRSLIEDFEAVDVVVVEDIPPVRMRKGRGGGIVKSHVRLLQSAGVVIGATRSRYLIEIHPTTWHSFLKDSPGYKDIKDDEMDCLVMGEAVKITVGWVLENPRKPKKKRTKKTAGTTLKCKIHPRYKGMRKPTSKKPGCTCQYVFDLNKSKYEKENG